VNDLVLFPPKNILKWCRQCAASDKQALGAGSVPPTSEHTNDADAVDHLDLMSLKKKKKKRKTLIPDTTDEKDESCYTYVDLLTRLYDQMEQNGHTPIANRQKTSIPAPRCARSGRNTLWLNFAQISRALHRPVAHMKRYCDQELMLKSSSLVQGNEVLSMRYKLCPGKLEALVTAYAKQYVACSTCQGIDTVLTKDAVTRLTFLECQSCQARRTVVMK